MVQDSIDPECWLGKKSPEYSCTFSTPLSSPSSPFTNRETVHSTRDVQPPLGEAHDDAGFLKTFPSRRKLAR